MPETTVRSGGANGKVAPRGTGERAALVGLVVWLALVGMDRLDLAGGRAGIVLTPFLVLTPLFLAAEAVRIGALRVLIRPPDRRASAYAVTLAGLLCVTLLSSLAGIDVTTSAKRCVGLAAIAVGTFLVAMAFVHRPGTRRALASGAEWGLVLAVLFNVAEVVYFLRGGTWHPTLGPARFMLEPATYGGSIPRLSGMVADANRAGLLYVVYMFLIVRGGEPGLRRRVFLAVGIVLTLLTLSRSAVVAGVVMALVGFVTTHRVRPPRWMVVASLTAVAAAALLLIASPSVVTGVGRAAEPISTRFSLREGSTQEHAYLLGRGIDEATESVRRAALGLGYGDSFHVLQDIFPDNKYGNFHSIYVTLFAESGVMALLLVIALLAVPILRASPYVPLIVGLCVFNVFYQASAEPAFWFILALAWLTSRMGAGAMAEARPESRPAPPISPLGTP